MNHPNEPVNEAAYNTIDARLRLLDAVVADLASGVNEVARFVIGHDPDLVSVPDCDALGLRLDSAIDVLQRANTLLGEVQLQLGIEAHAKRREGMRAVRADSVVAGLR